MDWVCTYCHMVGIQVNVDKIESSMISEAIEWLRLRGGLIRTCADF